jgi:hypothetical protein
MQQVLVQDENLQILHGSLNLKVEDMIHSSDAGQQPSIAEKQCMTRMKIKVAYAFILFRGRGGGLCACSKGGIIGGGGTDIMSWSSCHVSIQCGHWISHVYDCCLRNRVLKPATLGVAIIGDVAIYICIICEVWS